MYLHGLLISVQPVETDDELAKREALIEALTTFCNVVRKTQCNSPEDTDLLNSAGKLSMEHIVPIYRVGLSALCTVHLTLTGVHEPASPHILHQHIGIIVKGACCPVYGPHSRGVNVQQAHLSARNRALSCAQLPIDAWHAEVFMGSLNAVLAGVRTGAGAVPE